MMDPDLKAKWLAALRSGQYQQGRSHLAKQIDGQPMKHCCLGVLCEIIKLESTFVEIWKGGTKKKEFLFDGVSNSKCIPCHFEEKLGIYGHTDELMNMNDDGVSFIHIAEHIEATL